MRLPCGEERDVSEQLFEYLFEDAELAPEVLLLDIFQLVRNNPEIFNVFSRFRAREIVDRALDRLADIEESCYEELEYLQLDWAGEEGTDGVGFKLWTRMFVTGVGYPLQEPIKDDFLSFSVGERREWSMEFCDPAEIAKLPVRLKNIICIDSKNSIYMDLGFPCLGKILEGIFYCLSFFGDHEEKCALLDDLENERGGTEMREIDIKDLESIVRKL